MKNVLKPFLRKSIYFKLIFLSIPIIDLIAFGSIDKTKTIIDGISSALSYDFLITFLFAVFICNTIYLNKSLFANTPYLLRYQNKEQWLNKNRHLVMILNSIIYIMAVASIIIVACLRVNAKSPITFNVILNLTICLIRSLMLLLILNDIINYLYLLNNKKVIYYYIFIMVTLFLTHVTPTIQSNNLYLIDIFYYLNNYNLFNSFFLNIVYSLGIISVYYTINYIIKLFCLQNSEG